MNKYVYNWVLTGSVCGLLALIVYPLLIFVSLPQGLSVFLAAAFGPLLLIAFIGLYFILTLPGKSVTALLGSIFTGAGAVLVNLMMLVQLSVNISSHKYMEDADIETVANLQWITRLVDKVQLGIDVSWDVFVSLGTLFFGMAMMRHPRFGKIIGITGIIIGLILLFTNLLSFPTPPAEAGSFDFGPVMGLWYLAVVIMSLASLKWIKEKRQ